MVARLPKGLRLFSLVRNPLDFAYSKNQKRTLQLMRSERGRAELAEAGCFARVLERWVNEFPQLELKIFPADEMFADPVRFSTYFFQWLGIPNHPLSYHHEKFQPIGRRRVQNVVTYEDNDRFHSQA
eukprot:937261-Amphidinium_carterae.1